MTTNYICAFTFRDQQYAVSSAIGFCDFKDGFWVDERLKLSTNVLEIKFWIPPSAILYIEKRDV